jgi:glutamate N-acetyltransferase/amino-acid N-acetyltransferase
LAIIQEQQVKKVVDGGITSPKGFSADGKMAGLKKNNKDIGIILSEVPCASAAVYTKNVFQAAPLKVTQESLSKEGKLQAVVVNSKNANACTGQQGFYDAYEMRYSAAQKFNIPEQYVAVASTGVIGEFMPMDKIKNGIQQLAPTPTAAGAKHFQEAILTTDTSIKGSCYQTVIDGKEVTIAGAAKGSGMIHPNMATMLGFITTDVAIESSVLQQALRDVTNETFNRITVDGDSSTNDMVIVMASGLAGNDPLTPEHPQWADFYQLLKTASEDLSKSIARDGEGATKLVEVQVKGAIDNAEAGKIAKTIVGSSLVKTAVYGADANWGRILCAVGYSEATVDPTKVNISIGPIQLMKNGIPQKFSEENAKAYLQNETIVIYVDLQIGQGEGKAWGCDLTYDYVKINASYRT